MAGDLKQRPSALAAYLDRLVRIYETEAFIARDPISIPHGFDDPRDQEIIGFYAALLAWGRRETLLKKMETLCETMGYRPYRFVYGFDMSRDGRHLAGFVHRTFQPVDAIWLTHLLSLTLHMHGSLNEAFARHLPEGAEHVGPAIDGFVGELLALDTATPSRLHKHLAKPSSGSACKRIAMFLRWMVRGGPVDLGIWRGIDPSQLVLPLDVHSRRMVDRCGLTKRRVNDWTAVQEITARCREMCPEDPARFDFAFFGPGAAGVDPGPPPQSSDETSATCGAPT